MEETYYCPSGCQVYTGRTLDPECAACGRPMTLNSERYDEFHQDLEDRQIAAFEAAHPLPFLTIAAIEQDPLNAVILPIPPAVDFATLNAALGAAMLFWNAMPSAAARVDELFACDAALRRAGDDQRAPLGASPELWERHQHEITALVRGAHEELLARQIEEYEATQRQTSEPRRQR